MRIEVRPGVKASVTVPTTLKAAVAAPITPIANANLIAVPGPQGPPGPPGPAGPPGGSYHHYQANPDTVWTIDHGLGFYPNVTVIDSSHRVVYGEVEYPDTNTVVLTFSAAFAGEALLS